MPLADQCMHMEARAAAATTHSSHHPPLCPPSSAAVWWLGPSPGTGRSPGVKPLPAAASRLAPSHDATWLAIIGWHHDGDWGGCHPRAHSLHRCTCAVQRVLVIHCLPWWCTALHGRRMARTLLVISYIRSISARSLIAGLQSFQMHPAACCLPPGCLCLCICMCRARAPSIPGTQDPQLNCGCIQWRWEVMMPGLSAVVPALSACLALLCNATVLQPLQPLLELCMGPGGRDISTASPPSG